MGEKAETAKLLLRYSIRDEFTDQLIQTCNMKSRMCRGGSKDLYRILTGPTSYAKQYMNLDNLQIVSGLGHTFLRYWDDAFNRYLYIDPTLAQFNSTFEGIFVGDENDLRDIVKRQKNMKGYKLDIKDYVGPPLTIETNVMKSVSGASRKRRHAKRRKTLRK